ALRPQQAPRERPDRTAGHDPPLPPDRRRPQAGGAAGQAAHTSSWTSRHPRNQFHPQSANATTLQLGPSCLPGNRHRPRPPLRCSRPPTSRVNKIFITLGAKRLTYCDHSLTASTLSQQNELKPWLIEQYCLPEAPSGE